MREVLVVCAAIVREGRVLAARRADVDAWEFPGGKVEVGETSEQALVRELQEELGITIATRWHLDTIERDEDGWHLSLACYVCPVGAACEPVPLEHAELRWLTRNDVLDVEWLPADYALATCMGANWDAILAESHL